MGLLRKACRRVWKRLSSGKRACKTTSCTVEPLDTTYLSAVSATPASSLPGARAEHPEARPEASSYEAASRCSFPAAVVNVTTDLRLNQRGSSGAAQGAGEGDMLSATGESAWNVSSESDSGVCLGEFEEGVARLDDDGCSVWSDAEEEDECECDECSFARCETILEDWHISAKDLALDKVLSTRQDERVYR